MTFNTTLSFSSHVEGILKIEFSFYVDTDGPLAWLISITHFELLKPNAKTEIDS